MDKFIKPLLFLLLLISVMALANNPTVHIGIVHAQLSPPHVFLGHVCINGSIASDGTTVTAEVGGDSFSTKVGEGRTPGTGSYVLVVGAGKIYTGQLITFSPGGQTAVWELGGATLLDLGVCDPTTLPPPTEPPTASFSHSPIDPMVGKHIVFDASSSSDPDGHIVSFDQDFGDGSSGTGEMAGHAFNHAGDFTVTLTVTDNDGLSDSTSKVVQVKVDLSVAGIRLAQAVYDPDINGDGVVDLVSGKETVALVTVIAAGADSSDTDLVLIQLFIGSQVASASSTLGDIALAGANGKQIDLFFTPSGSGNSQVIVRVVLSNTIIDSAPIDVSVRDTRGLVVPYFDIRCKVACYNAATHVGTTMAESNRFIKDIFPIDPSEFRSDYSGNIDGSSLKKIGLFLDQMHLCVAGKLTAPLGQVDSVIGIVSPGYLPYHNKSGWTGATGSACGSIVQENTVVVAAHEMTHHFFPFMGHTQNSKTDGYWVSAQPPQPIQNALNYFDENVTFPPTTWVDAKTYGSLFTRQLSFHLDPPRVLLVGGLIDRNGNVTHMISYLMKDSMVSPSLPGPYSLKGVDADGIEVFETAFELAFMQFGQGGVISTDVDSFVLAVPYPDEVTTVEIQHEGNTLLTLQPETMLLRDAITAIPDFGFAKNPEQRRNALLNKVDALEKMIEAGEFTGALDKLDHDIRDKLDKWLKDDYEKETVLQYSKSEILDLVDELIARLEVQVAEDEDDEDESDEEED